MLSVIESSSSVILAGVNEQLHLLLWQGQKQRAVMDSYITQHINHLCLVMAFEASKVPYNRPTSG